ncbi:MAG TPA: SpoIID/LytB domain-containing protein [Phycisphaerae bacterium]|nr:SpoIID/LytB domain-containing protein [Phycisphaerae bacterium]
MMLPSKNNHRPKGVADTPPGRERAAKPAGVALRRWRHRTAVGVPLATLVLGCLLVGALLASCAQDRKISPVPLELPGGAPILRVRLTGRPVASATLWTSGGYRLLVDGRIAAESGARLSETDVTRAGKLWRFAELTAAGREVVLETVGRSYIHYGGISYRGAFHLLPAADNRFLIVNHLDVESYLAGVLPKELYPRWSAETYRAQAIAARTFALYHRLKFGRSRDYDLGDTTAWQVYGGFSAETEKAAAAVRATRGLVLAHGPENRERLFLVQYSACNGGYVNGAWVIRNAPREGPLAGGQKDEDGQMCPRYRWDSVRIRKADIYRAVRHSYPSAAALKRLQTVRVVSETPYHRPVWVDIVGTEGEPLRIRAEDLRLALLAAQGDIPAAGGLYSMNCRLRDLGDEIEFYEGRGWGHGVGMSQWGAEEKAGRGWSAEKILEFYYPGAKLVRAY